MFTKNYGLVIEPYKPTDDFFGGVTRSKDSRILVTDGQWDNHLPKYESQAGLYTGTKACVSFSALNCNEILAKAKYNKNVNYSDRFTAKMSGTTKRGNSMLRVADSIRHQGVVDERLWDFPRRRRKPPFTWNNYYSAIPINLKKQGTQWAKDNTVNYEWVATSKKVLMDALRYAPLQVTVYAWNRVNKYGVRPYKGKRQNHCVVLYGYKFGQYWKIFDSLNNAYEKVEWNYKFGWAMKYDLILNDKTMRVFDNNTLVQLVEGHGGFGLYINNRLYVDDTANIIASWAVRNNGNTSKKVATVKLDEWNAFEKYNLKNEKL